MTSRQGYEALLIELSKVNASPILVNDYVYYANKAVTQVCNKSYNEYTVNQQLDDNLRVLKSQAVLSVNEDNSVILPNDYFHILNCQCEFTVNSPYKCNKEGDKVIFGAKRLTADSWNLISQNYYNKPKFNRPYYYIHNVNINSDIPTNPIQLDTISETVNVIKSGTDVDTQEFPRVLRFNTSKTIDAVEKEKGKRYGNTSKVRMEIRCGNDNRFTLSKVIVDYLKVPQYITLTRQEIDIVKDNSQLWEFPDYMCQEIINELVKLVMANVVDPRLQTYDAVTQSIVSPVQQQTPKQ